MLLSRRAAILMKHDDASAMSGAPTRPLSACLPPRSIGTSPPREPRMPPDLRERRSTPKIGRPRDGPGSADARDRRERSGRPAPPLSGFEGGDHRGGKRLGRGIATEIRG